MERYDVAVVGAGFGGLGAALSLAQRGARVVLLERLTYPGGCASTFTRQGYRFESGATLFSGFGPGQLFDRWIKDLDLDVRFDLMDPVVELRTEELTLPISPDRTTFLETFAALPGAPRKALSAFFRWQEVIADVLWELFDDPALLPPLNATTLLRHLGRSPRYLRLLPVLGKTLEEVMCRRELMDFEPLRIYLDAVSQITVQAPASQAEAAFALGAMDYFFRGTGHIHGGIGELAGALAKAVETLGSEVRFATAVDGLTHRGDHWLVKTRRGELEATRVVANLLPQNLDDLLGTSPRNDKRIASLKESVSTSWGAAMLYLGLDEDRLDRDRAYHLELIGDPDRPFTEGNHIFCSVSGADEEGRAPKGQRVATISTHLDPTLAWDEDPHLQKQYVDEVQDRMRQTLRRRAPELAVATVFEMTASPRTFERFTNRRQGFVGGIPRVAGFHNYEQIWPVEIAPGMYLVGDSVFPGQSTLSVALGGVRVAEAISRG